MKRPPNVLLIMTDQLRNDCVGYAAVNPVSTPNLDQLAASGIRFAHAYSAIPTCCPARQALLRTKRPESFGGYWNYDITFPVAALDPGDYSWTRALHTAGYRSAYVGKWHVNPDHGPTDYGYDSYYGVEDYGRYFASIAPRAVYRNAWRGEPDVVSLDNSRTHILAKEASKKIRELSASQAPWHLRLDFPEPHLPCRPAGRFADMYNPAEIEPWGSFAETFAGKPFIQQQQLRNWSVDKYRWDDWAPIVGRYFGAISQVDDAIGGVIATLKQVGEYEDTIVIFTADHGDLCGAHRMVDKHYVMYDDVVRVPLLVSWPAVITSPREVTSFVSSTLDLGPTILDLTGLESPPDSDGRSLRGHLEGLEPESKENEVVATYNGAQFGLYCQRMLRTDRWKYIWNLTDVDELYDMDEDPYELTNRIDDPDLQETKRKLRGRLLFLLEAAKDPLCSGPWVKGQLTSDNPVANLEIPQTV